MMMLTDNVENRVKTIEIPILKVDNFSAELSYYGVNSFPSALNTKKVDLAVDYYP